MTREQEDRIIEKCRHRDADRTCLCVMVFFCLLNTCGTPRKDCVREIIREELTAAGVGYDMQCAFDEKMEFNATREDHKHEARRIAGGKQF
jgi:hypothetical protein